MQRALPIVLSVLCCAVPITLAGCAKPAPRTPPETWQNLDPQVAAILARAQQRWDAIEAISGEATTDSGGPWRETATYRFIYNSSGAFRLTGGWREDDIVAFDGERFQRWLFESEVLRSVPRSLLDAEQPPDNLAMHFPRRPSDTAAWILDECVPGVADFASRAAMYGDIAVSSSEKINGVPITKITFRDPAVTPQTLDAVVDRGISEETFWIDRRGLIRKRSANFAYSLLGFRGTRTWTYEDFRLLTRALRIPRRVVLRPSLYGTETVTYRDLRPYRASPDAFTIRPPQGALVLDDALSASEGLARQAVKEHPDDPAAHYALAEALGGGPWYGGSHRWRALEPNSEIPGHLRRAIQLDPDIALFHAALAECLARENAAESRKSYEEAIRLTPDATGWLRSLARLCLHQGDHAAALRCALQADAVDPDARLRIPETVVEAHLAAGQVDDAFAYAEEALAKGRVRAFYWAMHQLVQSHPARVLETCKRAVADGGVDAAKCGPLASQMLDAASALGGAPAARAEYVWLWREHPEVAAHIRPDHVFSGSGAEDRHSRREFAHNLEALAQVHPRDSSLLLTLAAAHAKAGQIEAAMSVFRRVNLADLESGAGDHPALTSLRAALDGPGLVEVHRAWLRAGPDRYWPLDSMVSALAGAGELDEALQVLGDPLAAARLETFPFASGRRSWWVITLLQQADRLDDLEARTKAEMQADPEDSWACLALAGFYQATSREDEAASLYAQLAGRPDLDRLANLALARWYYAKARRDPSFVKPVLKHLKAAHGQPITLAELLTSRYGPTCVPYSFYAEDFEIPPNTAGARRRWLSDHEQDAITALESSLEAGTTSPYLYCLQAVHEPPY